MERKLAAIFSADVQGYSRLMGQDEEATVHTLKAYRAVMTHLIQQYRGRVVDAPGDNLLAEFGSVVDAVKCATAIQQELTIRNDAFPEARQMRLRIGINLGDVLVDGERIYGDGVNIAARVESLADAGGICISGTVYDQVENKLALKFDYIGEQTVKNILRPIRVYRVVMEGAAGKQAQTAQGAVPAGRRTGRQVNSARDSAQVERRSVGTRRRTGLMVGIEVVVLGIIGVVAWQGMRVLGPDTVREKKAEIPRGSQRGTGVDAASPQEAPSAGQTSHRSVALGEPECRPRQ
jgi:class 3 adenylate cyclase